MACGAGKPAGSSPTASSCSLARLFCSSSASPAAALSEGDVIPYPLSIILFLPAAGAVLVAFFPGANTRAIRIWSGVVTGAVFALSIYLFVLIYQSGGSPITEGGHWLQIPTTPAFNVD